MDSALLWIKRNYGQLTLLISLFFSLLSLFLENRIICWLLYGCFIQQIVVLVMVIIKMLTRKQVKGCIFDLALVFVGMFFTLESLLTGYYGYPYHDELRRAAMLLGTAVIAVSSNINKKCNSK